MDNWQFFHMKVSQQATWTTSISLALIATLTIYIFWLGLAVIVKGYQNTWNTPIWRKGCLMTEEKDNESIYLFLISTHTRGSTGVDHVEQDPFPAWTEHHSNLCNTLYKGPHPPLLNIYILSNCTHLKFELSFLYHSTLLKLHYIFPVILYKPKF